MSRHLPVCLLFVALSLPATAAPPDAGTAPVLEARWSVPTVRHDQTRRWVLLDAVNAQLDRGRPVLHASEPLAVGDYVVFRSQRGVHAVQRGTGKVAWEAESAWSLDTMNTEAAKSPVAARWVAAYLGNGRSSFLHDNAVLGRLATDGNLVFAVEDLAVPPFIGAFTSGDAPYLPHFGHPVNDAAYHSRLQAYSLRTGKLMWELGGRGGKDDFSDSFFLGAPVVHDGKLLVPVEKGAGLDLACLDPKDGKLLWKLDLAAVRTGAHLDVLRRVHGVRVGVADGTIVCVLGEAVVGIDLETRSVAWAHTPPRDPAAPVNATQPAGIYQPANAPPGLAASGPAMADGRVVFNTPGGTSLVCLRLRDGALMWRTNAAREDVYLGGVVDGRVLLVGRRGVRALTLTDGQSGWFAETGEPSGRGVAVGGVYHLPLRRDARTNRAGVVSLDVASGKVVAWTTGREATGNLALAGRDVVSQALDRVTLFPQIREALTQADEQIKKNRGDPPSRLTRGGLRLSSGDASGAVEDFRAALAAEPAAEVKAKAEDGLFEGLTRLLEDDFAAGEKHLAEYEKLCKAAPAEERQRTSEMHYLVGRGRERQSRTRDAARSYLLHLTTAPEGDPRPVLADSALRSQRPVWVASHVRGMVGSAPAAERAGLLEEVAAVWKSTRGIEDAAARRTAARRLAAGPLPAPELQLDLAARLAREKDFMEAEMILLPLARRRDDAASAGRAVEALAHLSLARGLPEEAGHFVRELGRDFADVAVRDGKTGAALAQDASTDARLRPFLQDAAAGSGKFQVRSLPPGELRTPQQFLCDPHGDVAPWFRGHALSVSLNDNTLKLTDAGGKEEWSERLSPNSFRNVAFAVTADRLSPLVCRVYGHLAVLMLGERVYAVDPLARKVLWERSLLTGSTLRAGAVLTAGPGDGLTRLQSPDGSIRPIGQVAAVAPRVVCVQTADALLGLDALSGAVLWQRGDVEPGGSFFHDEEHVFSVRPGDAAFAATRAFSLRDGSAVKVPDCSALFVARLGQIGRKLLVADAGRALALRSYDALTGKDVWRREFAAGSRAVSCVNAEFAAAVDKDGQLTVLDATTGKERVTLKLDPAHLGGAQELRLLADAEQFYVLPNAPASPEKVVSGAVTPNVQPGSGLRTLPVHGWLYAFRRENGKIAWRTEVESQHLLLGRFDELPAIVLTSRYQALSGGAASRTIKATAPTTVIDKQRGKLLYDHDSGWNNQPFHAVIRDARSGTMELVGNSGRLRVTQE